MTTASAGRRLRRTGSRAERDERIAREGFERLGEAGLGARAAGDLQDKLRERRVANGGIDGGAGD